MAKYAVIASRTASPTTPTVGTIAATATPRRGKLYDLIVGCQGAPADNIFQWLVQRFTAPGTSTAVTPQALDPADAAALSAAGQNHTVEPTYTANAFVIEIPLNQRAAFRWVAAPGGEVVFPATNANGLGLTTPIETPLLIQTTMHFEEQ